MLGLVPRKGNYYGRKHRLTIIRQGQNLVLTIKNERGSWATDLWLAPDEVARVMREMTVYFEKINPPSKEG